MDLNTWMNEIDNLCYAEVGLSIHDLPDMDFRAEFDAGTTPKQFADQYLNIDSLMEMM